MCGEMSAPEEEEEEAAGHPERKEETVGRRNAAESGYKY